MKKYTKFIELGLVNVVLLYLATLLMPTSFALGNSIFTTLQSLFFTAFVWNYVLWNAEAELKKFDLDFKEPNKMMLTYFGLNFVSLWLLARFSFISGFGAASFVHLLVLAFVANFVQYKVWKALEKK